MSNLFNVKNVALLFLMFSLYSCSKNDVETLESLKTDPLINKQNWNLIWEDNFNTIDTISSWSRIPKGGVAWNKYMDYNPNCFTHENGEVTLRGIINENPSDDLEFLTGGLWTRGKKTIDYGKIEVRAKMNKVYGAWPAIWMISDEKKWPEGGEIDIVETYNREDIINHTIHTPFTLNNNVDGHVINHKAIRIKNKSEYNTYGVIINETEIIYTINGIITFIYPNLESKFQDQYPFGCKKFLILSMQLNYSSTVLVDKNDLPAEMTIDWVRFYMKIDKNLPDYEKVD